MMPFKMPIVNKELDGLHIAQKLGEILGNHKYIRRLIQLLSFLTIPVALFVMAVLSFKNYQWSLFSFGPWLFKLSISKQLLSFIPAIVFGESLAFSAAIFIPAFILIWAIALLKHIHEHKPQSSKNASSDSAMPGAMPQGMPNMPMGDFAVDGRSEEEVLQLYNELYKQDRLIPATAEEIIKFQSRRLIPKMETKINEMNKKDPTIII